MPGARMSSGPAPLGCTAGVATAIVPVGPAPVYLPLVSGQYAESRGKYSLDLFRERYLVEFENPVHPDVAEEEADEVLVAVLAVDNADLAGVAAVDEGPRGVQFRLVVLDHGVGDA